ncbi:MAG TPA: hypothetical protein DDW52_27435 [Planctomycetaceae bacterium]|nr:hypothetical protein [Planctomycetaceae bacterium]
MLGAKLRLSLIVFSCTLTQSVLRDAPFALAEDFDLYYLGGQSNMEGFGSIGELSEEQAKAVPNVFIFHTQPLPDQQEFNPRSQWQPLKPGHGTGFRVDGSQPQLSNRFGVELSLGRHLSKLRPERKIALVKYARNGSSIDAQARGHWGCWEPDFDSGDGDYSDQNQYDYFLATLRSAMQVSDIDGDGETDRLIPRGIVCMQGESDGAHTREIAERYEANLKRMTDLFRAALRSDDLPIVVGRISYSDPKPEKRIWKHGEIIREAQAAFCRKDPAARLVTTTDSYSYSDPAHYDSAGYLDLGTQFAEALVELQSSQNDNGDRTPTQAGKQSQP